MKRFASLCACLAILGSCIALVPTAEAKPKRVQQQCCINPVPATAGQSAAGAGPAPRLVDSYCLQNKLYEDDSVEIWSVDHYSTDNCSDLPNEELAFLSPGQMGPQACTGSDYGCLSQTLTFGLVGLEPKMQAPLELNQSYLDRIKHSKVSLNRGGQPTEWHPHSTLSARGELVSTFVKVPIGVDKFIAVRLSDGIAEMRKADFHPSIPEKMRKHRIPNRVISIGFETKYDPAEIKNLAPATPTEWSRYPGSKTAFKVEVNHRTYYVVTSQPVIVTQ